MSVDTAFFLIMFDKLIDAFDHQVSTRGDATALIAPDRLTGELIRSSWNELARQIDKSAGKLLPRDRVEIISDNSHDQIVEVLACMRCGVAEVSIDPRFPPARSEHSRLHDDVAIVLFTSGTTGEPRGVMLTHTNLVGNAAAKLAAVPQSPDDVRLMVLPMSHAYARTCDFGTWLLSGCTLAVTTGFAGLMSMSRIVNPTLMNVVPSIAYELLKHDLSSLGLNRLRLLGCGGAPLSSEAFSRWRGLGVTVIQGYGLTESGPVICSATAENATAGLVGDFVDGWESDIRSGELFVRGPHVMKGYWDDAESTSRKIDAEGWLRTGDSVTRDKASGQMRILGRFDDVIVMPNGSKISPAPIEREVERISGVNHAILCWRERLEIWIDGNCEDLLVVEAVSKHPHCKKVTVHHFDSPLSCERGELTVKGTIRRSRILQHISNGR